jgi:hypothetical protein
LADKVTTTTHVAAVAAIIRKSLIPLKNYLKDVSKILIPENGEIIFF